MKQKHEGPLFTPTVRDLLVCPRCGCKTLSYEGTETEFVYECLSPSCDYWSRKPRMRSNGSLVAVMVVFVVLLTLLLSCFAG